MTIWVLYHHEHETRELEAIRAFLEWQLRGASYHPEDRATLAKLSRGTMRPVIQIQDGPTMCGYWQLVAFWQKEGLALC